MMWQEYSQPKLPFPFIFKKLGITFLNDFPVASLQMARTLEALGLMMIGLAKNGARIWKFAMSVDLG